MKHTLVIHELSAKEKSFLETVIRLSSQLSKHWQIAHGVFNDVVLFDSEDSDTENRPRAQVFVSVGSPCPPARFCLKRPLRAENLIQILEDAGRLLQKITASSAVAFSEDTKARYRLLKWPPTHILNSDRSALRLATALSRATMTIDELCVGTGTRPSQAEDFLAKLKNEQLLRIEVSKIENPAKSLPLASPEITTHKKSLFASIRARLGL